jgi:hypothetical protein
MDALENPSPDIFDGAVKEVYQMMQYVSIHLFYVVGLGTVVLGGGCGERALIVKRLWACTL